MPTAIIEHSRELSSNQKIEETMNIGIIENDQLLFDLLKMIFELSNYRVTPITSCKAILDHADNGTSPIASELNLLLIDCDYIDPLHIARIKTTHPTLPLLLLSFDDLTTTAAMRRVGLTNVMSIEKPFKVAALLDLIETSARR